MLTIEDLKFVEIDNPDAPAMTCNFCGKEKPLHGGYMADVPITGDAHHSFVICSKKCLADFYKTDRGLLNGYINDTFEKSRALHFSL